ncbi:MAG TPA: DUF6183 family protein [Actinomycetota bacterium]|nr:DUF6183 family protein [Actinomycetota bacterium]
MDSSLRDLIEAGDLNALLRSVDGLCAARQWEDLLDLADACEEAVERGKQMWPIAVHIDYRLALEAPAWYAAHVLDVPGAARFSHGPPTEVAASTHTWEELAPHITEPQIAAYLAQERVLRGEVLEGDERAHPEVLELPLRLMEWEPTYPLATFFPDRAEVAEPWKPRAPLDTVSADPATELDDPDVTDLLLDLVQPWTAESNGAARAIIVEGDAAGAVSALTYDAVDIGALEPAEAIQRMAWAAASGGAHGRRRGTAFGRYLAWVVSSQLAEVPWPPNPEELGHTIEELRWFRWEEDIAEEGWSLRIAIENPENGWAAALGATDILEEDEATG